MAKKDHDLEKVVHELTNFEKLLYKKYSKEWIQENIILIMGGGKKTKEGFELVTGMTGTPMRFEIVIASVVSKLGVIAEKALGVRKGKGQKIIMKRIKMRLKERATDIITPL